MELFERIEEAVGFIKKQKLLKTFLTNKKHKIKPTHSGSSGKSWLLCTKTF